MDPSKTVQFVGRTLSFSGKRLFDILSRLNNFGAGRIVYRNTFLNRYESPSYYRLTKVEPDMSDPSQAKIEGHLKSKAYGIKIFRGENQGETQLTGESKADWKLVSKMDEKEFLAKASMCPPRVKEPIPTEARFPPTIEYLKKKAASKAGVDIPTPMMKLKTNTVQY